MVQKSIKLALHFYFSMKFFLVEFRANTGEIQQLGKFGAKKSESVKQKCQANLNHAPYTHWHGCEVEKHLTTREKSACPHLPLIKRPRVAALLPVRQSIRYSITPRLRRW